MENRKSFHLDQAAIRMVKEPPLYSEFPLNTPQAVVKLLADIYKDYDREVFTVVNLRPDLKPINPVYIDRLKSKHKILLLGNHDRRSDYIGLFDEIYSGPLFIADKILLSHEPIYGLSWCLNIHGHDHSNMEKYADGCKHLNIAANVCDYTPVNLGLLIKNGILSGIESIHRETINRASGR